MRLLFQDETKLCLCPDPGTDYHPIGRQTRVPSPGRSTARWLFGTVDVASGEGLYQVFEHATTGEFLRHLDDLLQLFPNERLLLVTDKPPGTARTRSATSKLTCMTAWSSSRCPPTAPT